MIRQRTLAEACVFCTGRLAEVRVFHRCAGQPCQIPRCGEMPLLVQAVRILKMRIFHSELCRPCVHPRGKTLHGAVAQNCQRDCRVVAGAQHQSIEQLPPRHALTGTQIHGRAFDPDRLGGDGVFRVQRQRLAGQQAGHDLRRAGDAAARICVQLIQDAAAFRVH